MDLHGPVSRQDPFYSSAKTGWSSQSNAGKSGGGPGKQTASINGSSERSKSQALPTDLAKLCFTAQADKNTLGEGGKAVEGDSSQIKRGAEYVAEEGELIDSGSGAMAEGEQCLDKCTQQSSVFDNNVTDMDTEGEELLDYEEEPISTEITEMANLEKTIEVRAAKLIKEQAINIPPLDSETHTNAGQTSSGAKEDSDEIDWDKVGSNLWSDEEGDFTLVERKNAQRGVLRRSSRNLGNNMKIQEKAEASKKKNNEISGKTSSFTVFNTIDQHILESVALTSNIRLGDNEGAVAANISTIQANENARAALFEASKRIVAQSMKTNIESEHQQETFPVQNEGVVEELIANRPPEKPPRQCPKSQNTRVSSSRNKKRK
jgi:hypothetical protein